MILTLSVGMGALLVVVLILWIEHEPGKGIGTDYRHRG